MRSSQDTYTLANGVNMPCIGLGTYQSPDAVASAAGKDAMAAGYRLIDTAAAYGNERGVGQGIRISGVPREEIFVTSKLRNAAHGYQATLEAFDMTTEAITGKLMWILGQTKDHDKVREMFYETINHDILWNTGRR